MHLSAINFSAHPRVGSSGRTTTAGRRVTGHRRSIQSGLPESNFFACLPFRIWHNHGRSPVAGTGAHTAVIRPSGIPTDLK
jgi:hypothetical protein